MEESGVRRWGRWKERISKVFKGTDKEGKDGLPRIVMTGGDEVQERSGLGDKQEVGDRKMRKTDETKLVTASDQLARAHQDVISQMREAMLEARGGKMSQGQKEFGEQIIKQKEGIKHPEREGVRPTVPTSKASAVAKIREAIAEAKKRETDAGQVTRPPRTKSIKIQISESPQKAPGLPENGQESRLVETEKKSTDSTKEFGCPGNSPCDNDKKPTITNTTSQNSDPSSSLSILPPISELSASEAETKLAKAAACRAKLRAALLGKEVQGGGGVKGIQEDTEGPSDDKGELKTGQEKKDDDENKAARIAAVKAKMREALVSAAMVEVSQGKAGVKRRESLGSQKTQANVQERRSSQTYGRRSSNTGEGEQRSTIWEFFEEGKKKGTCRTCGYVVGTKHNQGGLTRHLSLVHSKQYRDYTARMEKNWTHGMMEKHLNIAVPKNF